MILAGFEEPRALRGARCGRGRWSQLVAALALCACRAPDRRTRQAAPRRVGGHPNLNGIWQAMNSAHWNLEGHAASQLKDFWRLGATSAPIPAGQSVVKEGKIPYLPEALARRDENRAGWPKTDPEAACYLPGIPRATYLPHPFQIVQGDDDILFVYSFANANRAVHMKDHRTHRRGAGRSVDGLVERHVGRRHARRRGHRERRSHVVRPRRQLPQRCR